MLSVQLTAAGVGLDPIRLLQAAINRFAAVAGFDPLPLSGTIDRATASAAVRAAVWDFDRMIAASETADQQALYTAMKDEFVAVMGGPGGTSAVGFLQNNHAEFTRALTQIADEIGLDHVEAPIVEAPAKDTSDRNKSWFLAGGGLVLGLVAGFAFGRRRRT